LAPKRTEFARQVVGELLDLAWPPSCPACAEPPAGSGTFCQLCSEALEPVPTGCQRCGLPGPDALCGCCQARPPAFDSLAAGGLFGGPLADAVHALKYQDRPALARPLGAWLASRLKLPTGALVISVPLARRRRRERGYDQASLLADSLARATGGRRLRRQLTRVRDTPPQVGRDREARARNVAGAFVAGSGVAGRDLVLVDDVVTTGATADAAARALKDAGARSVKVVALARAE
jgi:ComF family protein